MAEAPTIESLFGRLSDIADVLPALRLIVVFGSRVRGRARAGSDVDVAVLTDGPVDLDAAYMALAPRLRANGLDLVDLNRAGPLLAFEVARHGRLLFERAPGEFRQFQSLAFRRYADTKRLRDAQKRSIDVFLARGRPA
jgi:predicted nucleotidyltransferase